MDFVGNKKTVSFLQKSLEKGAFNHAYIFSGPQGVGKTTLAKIFSQALITGKEMNLDVSFQDKQALLDLIVIEPEIVEKKDVIKTRDIPIEAVRQAQQSLSLFPYHGKFKVLIIKDAHRMKNSPQNALLKLLEEPNQTSILILITSELDKILPTVQSRCEKINFSLATQIEIAQAFSGKNNFASDIPVLAMGRPAIAKNILENSEELELRRQQQQQLEKLRKGTLNERMLLAEEFSKDVRRTLETFNAWIWLLRLDALSNSDELVRNKTYETIERIQESITLLKSTNANGRLLLEVLFMDI
ncbi:MAG: AAA family ATPase [Candidatus Moranbacteria bacterium]|nr:AAA family ATPase [Candidatus Moranbacteria bacterium]